MAAPSSTQEKIHSPFTRLGSSTSRWSTHSISHSPTKTPKTIQTKSERANLVYAIKVKVKNDGYLKIGMYGEVLFKSKLKNEKRRVS